MTAAEVTDPLAFTEHEETKQTAAAGYNAWLKALPEDDWSDAVDPDQERPIRWTDDGWVETPRGQTS